MIKAFLSHSSAQKTFVRSVIKTLGVDNCFIDEHTFENGMPTIEEIYKAIGKSNIFVFFISEESITSDWVKEELSNVRDYVDNGDIQFLPLIIDDRVLHSDARIKPWIRKDYNLQLYRNPILAARRIKEEIRNKAWEKYPDLRNKSLLFQGRDEEMSFLKKEYYNGNMENRRCLVISGFPPGVGRKRLIEEYIKTQLAPLKSSSYEPIVIELNEGSIEDLIFQLNDIVLVYTNEELLAINAKPKNKKVDVAVELINEVYKSKEYCIIRDNGACVLSDGRFSDWFCDILQSEDLPHCITLFLASSHFLNPRTALRYPSVISLNLNPLKRESVRVLFYAYASNNDLCVSSDYDKIIAKIPGMPSYIFRVADLMKIYSNFNKMSSEVDALLYGEEKSFVPIINKIKEKEISFNILVLLSNFEFISIDIVEQVLKKLGKDDLLYEALDCIYSYGLYERIGGNGKYIRINAVVADYLNRNRIELDSSYKRALHAVLKDVISKGQYSDDLSGYLIGIQEAIKSNIKGIDRKYLIPSFTLKVIIDEYKEKQYGRVVALSRRFLEDCIVYYDEIVRSVRYWLCMALCRLQNDDFFSEVDNFSGYSKEFLLGFYYRCKKNYSQAYIHYKAALERSKADNDKGYVAKAKHEIVIVLLKLNDYITALSEAEDNYNRQSTNKYHVEAFFNCLIRNSNPDSALLRKLLKEFEQLAIDVRTNTMYKTMCLEYDYYVNHDNCVLSKLRTLVKQADKDIRYYPYRVLKEIAKKMNANRAIDDLEARYDSELNDKDEELEN